MSGVVFKNKLERLENSSKLAKHRAMLHQILRSTQREFIVKQPYKELLKDNSKGEYFKYERKREIDLENYILLSKIKKIKTSRRSKSYWMGDGHSHSLNETSRQNSLKSIDAENKRIRASLNQQKPSVSFQKMGREAEGRQKWINSFSKVQKYKLPGIEKSNKPSGQLSQSSDTIGYDRSGNRYGSVKLDLDYREKVEEEIAVTAQ